MKRWTGYLLAGYLLAGWLACGGVCRAGGTNLLTNGTFEAVCPTNALMPLGWELPDGLGIRWAEAGDGHGKAIRMDTRVSEKAVSAQRASRGITAWRFDDPGDGAIGATYGLSFYSHWMPVEAGATYRLSFDVRGPAGGAKVWVRAYGMYRGRERRRYERLVSCTRSEKGWTAYVRDFNPARHRPEVQRMRVMLYAFWPAGVYWFDNVRLERLVTP